MHVTANNHTITPFFERFFHEHPIENDVFVIEVAGKYFIFETDTVINMIINFSIKKQESIKRQLQIYNYLNQDLRICLTQIANDYIRELFEESKKIESYP